MSQVATTSKVVEFVQSTLFHRVSLFLIIVACVIIGVETNREFYAEHFWWMHLLDRIIISLFAVELLVRYSASIKLNAARGIKKYFVFFTDTWHVIDVIVVIVCLLPTHTEYFAVLRTLRILRVFLLVDELPRLKLLVNALIKSIPSMGYVMLLLMLHFFAYAVIATDLFGVTNQEDFGSLGASLFTLFRVVTGDGWGDILRCVVEHSPYLNQTVVILYFISFIVIGAMIFLNLFIGVITNEIAELKADDERQKRLKKQLENHASVDTLISTLEDQMNQISVTLTQLKAVRGEK